MADMILLATEFQSAPRALARGDALAPLRAATDRMFQSAPRALARGDTMLLLCFYSRREFQSAPRALARGDLPLARDNLPLIWFQSAPRALARGDPKEPGIMEQSRQFQSAPRALARGDCGAANQQHRKALISHSRERDEFLRVCAVLIFKERLKVSASREVSVSRERGGVKSALRVRGSRFIG